MEPSYLFVEGVFSSEENEKTIKKLIRKANYERKYHADFAVFTSSQDWLIFACDTLKKFKSEPNDENEKVALKYLKRHFHNVRHLEVRANTLEIFLDRERSSFDILKCAQSMALNYGRLKLTNGEKGGTEHCRSLVWQVDGEERRVEISPIVSTNGERIDHWQVEDYYRILTLELHRTSQSKLDGTNELDGNVSIEALAVACLSLQCLAVCGNRVLLLEASNFKEWIFVLYNYARLNVLFHTYEKAVTDGILPPLPPLEELNPKLLATQENWELVWLFVAQFPVVVSLASAAAPHLWKSQTVVRFLHQLSHHVSAYYSRYHVLPLSCPADQQLHLYPQMFARLIVLSAVRQVMKVAFGLLGVKPPHRL